MVVYIVKTVCGVVADKKYKIMGLDNGIILKVNPKNLLNINKLIKLDTTYDEIPNTMICYWRKCWGIRDAIINKLHFSTNGGQFKLDAEDIPVIIKLLFTFYGEKEWSDVDAIWEWEEFKDTLRQQILNLTWLYDYMLANPEAKVYFYDSF